MKFKDLKKGDILSESQFYVVDKKVGNEVQLTNRQGTSIVLDDKYVESCLSSGDQYNKEEKISRTDLAEKCIRSSNKAITICFQKKVQEKDVLAEIESLYPNTGKIMAKADFIKKAKAAIKTALEGEERVIRGYHTGQQDEFGRIQFTDMEITSGHNLRQVDTRTISYAIIDSVKYVVK